MQIFTKLASRERPLGVRIAALAVAAIVFLYLIPLAVLRGGPSLDRQIGLPSIQFGTASYLLGGAMGIAGLLFAFWSIGDQIILGRGTPLPLMPTQTLLTGGPFAYCRNPMTLGTILAYSGLGIAGGTISGVGLILCFGALLVLYIKGIEEKELALRFGEAYLAYKRQVPFMIPRLPKRPQAPSRQA